MRLPVSSETDAFRAVFVVAALVAVCLIAGSLFGFVPALVVASLSLIALFAWALLPSGSSLQQADEWGRAQHRARRTLLIANEAPTDEEFREQILAHLPARTMLEVHAPVLQSRAHFVTTDVDRERMQARGRLIQTLAAARHAGVTARGEVGDPIDPLAGVEDELRRYSADEVIVTTHPIGDSNWLESELVDRLRAELHAPVVQVVLGLGSREAPG